MSSRPFCFWTCKLCCGRKNSPLPCSWSSPWVEMPGIPSKKSLKGVKKIYLKLTGTELEFFFWCVCGFIWLRIRSLKTLRCVAPSPACPRLPHTAVVPGQCPWPGCPLCPGLRFPKQIPSGTMQSLFWKAWALKERYPASLTLLKCAALEEVVPCGYPLFWW